MQLARDEPTLRRLTFADAPLVALIDGEDPPAIEAAALASALAAMPEKIVRVLWAADVPMAAALARALDRRGTYVLRVARNDGLDPLLDLVRSRHEASGRPDPAVRR